MTATRNASLVPENYLIKRNVDFVAVTGEEPPKRYPMSYDKEELRIYGLILLFSALPAWLLWLVG